MPRPKSAEPRAKPIHATMKQAEREDFDWLLGQVSEELGGVEMSEAALVRWLVRKEVKARRETAPAPSSKTPSSGKRAASPRAREAQPPSSKKGAKR